METDLVSETLWSLDYRRADKVRKPSNAECYTQSSEPFRIYKKNLVLIFTSCVFQICLFFRLQMDLPNDPLPSGFLTKISHFFLISLMSTTCSAHLSCPDKITIHMMNCADYESCCANFSSLSVLTLPLSLSLSLSLVQIFFCAQCNRYSDWLWAGRLRSWSLSPGRVKNFLFSMSSRPALGSTQPPI
jgi:hypothetical protein